MEEDFKDHEFELFDPEEPEEKKRQRYFARSVSNSVIGGVCGGIGEYINIEPNLLRVIFVLGSFAGGWGIITYIAAVLLIPIKPDPLEYTNVEIAEFEKSDPKTIIGTAMILSGAYFIIAPTGLFHLFKFLGGSTEFALTILFLSAGVSIIKHSRSSKDENNSLINIGLLRSRKDKRFMGVCGGLAVYLNIDSTLLRVIYIVSIIFTLGFSILVYFVFSFFVPYEPELINYDKE